MVTFEDAIVFYMRDGDSAWIKGWFSSIGGSAEPPEPPLATGLKHEY